MLDDQYKIHETSADRLGERAALSVFRDKILPGCLLEQTPPRTKIDAKAFKDDTLQAVLEVKRRVGSYSTWPVEIQKLEAGWQESERTGVPFYFIFEWNRAKHFFLNMTEAKSIVEASGKGYMKRGDRDELPDLCYYIDRKLFTEIV